MRGQVILTLATSLVLLLFVGMTAPYVYSSAIINLSIINFMQSERWESCVAQIFPQILISSSYNTFNNPRVYYHLGLRSCSEERFVECIEQLETYRELKVDVNPFVGLALGTAYAVTGDATQASRIWTTYNSYDLVLQRASVRLQAGFDQRNHDFFQASLKDYLLALQINNKSVDARIGAARALQSLQEHAKAIEILNEAYGLAPDSLFIHNLLVTSYVALQNFPMAAFWDTEAAKLTTSEDAHLYRGRAAIWQGLFLEATRELRYYVENYPDNLYGYELLCINA